MLMRVLIVGCGYVGLPLGEELARQGHEVCGVRRNRSAGAALCKAGITPMYADVSDPASLNRLPRAFDWVINCAASGGGDSSDYRRLYVDGNRNLLAWLQATPPERFIYTSSTSVYAQDDGSVVTEESVTNPQTETGRILLQAEHIVLDSVRDSGFPAIVLRLAGIYGPGRGYWFRQFLQGEARIEDDGGRMLNMIHRDDVVGAGIASLERGRIGQIYNVVDAEPVTQIGFFRWLAETLNQPLPPVTHGTDEAVRKRGSSNKRVSNRRLKTELGYKFRFPTFREGYAPDIGRLLAEGR